MQVNEEVYGAKSNWVKIFTTAEVNKFVENVSPLQAVFPTSNGWNSELLYAFQSGKLTLNKPVDDSIATVGVDSGSWLTDRKWVAVGKNSSTGEYFSDKFVCKMKKENVNPVAFSALSSFSATNDNIQTTSPYTSFWGYDQTYNANSGNLKGKLYTYINIKNTYYVIFVRVTDAEVETITYNDSYNTVTYDLYTYFKYVDKDGKHYYEKYPVMLAVYLVPVYDYKTLTSGSYRGTSEQTAKPVVMNSFEDAFYPYDDSGKPLQILTYQQSAWGLKPSGFSVAKPFSDPTSVPLNYTISHSPIVLAGHHSVWLSSSQTSNYMYQEYTNINWRSYLDGKVWRIVRWLHIVTNDNADELYNEYMKQTAYLGMFFTDSWDYATKVPTWDYDHCFCGIIDDNGVTHGEYSTGEKNREQKQWNWESFDDNNYSPSKKPHGEDKEKPSSPYNYNSNLNVGLDAGNYYAMSKYELNVFKEWQHTVTNPDGPLVVGTPAEGQYSYEELGYNLQFRFNGAYPEGQILSLMYFPFLVDEEMKRNSTLIPNSYITMGNYKTTGTDNWYGSKLLPAKATKIDSGSNFVEMESGEYPIEEYYGDFRDYAPYTSMSLIIPFHGTIELDPGTWYNHTINTRMVVDIITGSSTTVIERDGIPIDTVQGQVGIPVNLIARNVGDYASTLISNSQSLNQQKFDNVKLGVKSIAKTTSALSKGAVGIATKNIGLVGSAVGDLVSAGADVMSAREKYKNTEFQIEHNQADSTVVSSNAPSVAQYLEMFPRLVIRYPTLMSGFDGETYGKTVGYACNIQDTVGNFKGFTVFSGVDLTGLTCQEDIKTRIFGLLQQGVIL